MRIEREKNRVLVEINSSNARIRRRRLLISRIFGGRNRSRVRRELAWRRKKLEREDEELVVLLTFSFSVSSHSRRPPLMVALATVDFGHAWGWG
ncbi:hypothetical protein SLA2020_308610 [Shorea laevis]